MSKNKISDNISAKYKTVDDQMKMGKGLVSTAKLKKGDRIALYAKSSTLTPDQITLDDHVYLLKDPDDPTKSYFGNHDGGDAILINDACHPSIINKLYSCTTFADVQQWTSQYVNSCTARINVLMRKFDGEMWAVAKCHIAPNKPLLGGYGPEYWIDLVSINSTNPRTKLTCVLYLAYMRRCWPLVGNGIPILPIINSTGIGIVVNPKISIPIPDQKTKEWVTPFVKQWFSVLGYPNTNDPCDTWVRELDVIGKVWVSGASKKPHT
jgi:hypothetical protein